MRKVTDSALDAAERKAHGAVHEYGSDAWKECPHRNGEGCYGEDCCVAHDGHSLIHNLWREAYRARADGMEWALAQIEVLSPPGEKRVIAEINHLRALAETADGD